ncbi:MAG: HNH endonuclease [Candidatus Bathyarchaeota archaeon]|nr:HNH endonuclease [Candidatus Bathyarchaeota archaeon]
MAREIIKNALKKEIFNKYGSKCYVCGYSLKPALRAHHTIPTNLGGKDHIDNFVLLCSNCHTLVHFYSSKRYWNKEIKHYLTSEYTEDKIEKLKELISRIQKIKKEVEENKNLWIKKDTITERPYTLEEAINIVSRRNKFTDDKKKLLSRVLISVLENIPQPIFKKCSFRLLRNGKYISINLMNHLLFRTPAYGDYGEPPKFDCYLTFPKDKIPSNLKPIEERDVFYFRYFNCVNLGLSYAEVLEFTSNEWNLFKEACEMAHNVRKTRSWISNIDVEKHANISTSTTL